MIEEKLVFIKGTNNKYKISNYGRVYSLITNKFLKPCKTAQNYLAICIKIHNRKRTIKIHRLVAIHFISNPYNKPVVNHLDENNNNNRVDNLEWATYKENTIYSSKKMKKKKKVCKYGFYQFDKNGNYINVWENPEQASKFLKYDSSGIRRAAKGILKSAAGYFWRYFEDIVIENEIIKMRGFSY